MLGDEGPLQPDMTPLENRYEPVRMLGQGGMATVYLVRHLGLQSLHALKVLAPEWARNDEVRARFLNEGRIQAARLKHPHIVQVTDIVTSPVAGLVMEYVEGDTLGEYCRKSPDRRLKPNALLEVFLPVLAAMEEAHRQQVVHRDLKPDNILVGKDLCGRLRPVVMDFGIAKILDMEQGQSARTRAGTRMGTLAYMSPEQIQGAHQVDIRSDIFSLGALLYEVATGRVAFEARSEFELMKQVTEGRFAAADRVVSVLPAGLVYCIHKALEVDPDKRFQDCAAFRACLQEALGSSPATAPAPSQPPAGSHAQESIEPAQVTVLGEERGTQHGVAVKGLVVMLLALIPVLGGLLYSEVQEASLLREEVRALRGFYLNADQQIKSLSLRLEESEARAQKAEERARKIEARSRQTRPAKPVVEGTTN